MPVTRTGGASSVDIAARAVGGILKNAMKFGTPGQL